MGPLVDTKEMYLRTVWELEEEGVPPLRARLAERLHVSQPSVTDTVSRLEAEGLLTAGRGRELSLTPRGREIATGVMRKHRLAELLLTDVIGVPWTEVHLEACRWEHVISDAVERRLVDLLGAPTTCPHGNPIPGAAGSAAPDPAHPLIPLLDAARSGARVVVRRISEQLQTDPATLVALDEQGLRPGATTESALSGGHVRTRVDGRVGEVTAEVAAQVYVTAC